jgi:hypothetical protein
MPSGIGASSEGFGSALLQPGTDEHASKLKTIAITQTVFVREIVRFIQHATGSQIWVARDAAVLLMFAPRKQGSERHVTQMLHLCDSGGADVSRETRHITTTALSCT